MTPYERLLALAQEELELVLAGRFADTAALDREREAIVASLPEAPPAEAAPALEAAERAVRSTIAATLAGMNATRRALARIREGRDALQSYAPPARSRALERRG